MGITPATMRWLLRHLPATRPLRILELGNQHLYFDTESPAKSFFQSMGIDHVSIDLNGEDGAIPIDLSRSWWHDYAYVPCQDRIHLIMTPRPFDVVTDFGTSEHVTDLWECLRNVHDATGEGSLIFHRNPEPGSWPGHGLWHRGTDFYEQFADMAYYRIIELFRDPALGNTETGWETCCLMVRGSKTFPSREEFATLPVHTS